MARERLVFLRNGERREVGEVDPNETLLDYLRLREGKKGTKEGCNEGDCGACTVAIGRVKNGGLIYEPVNACIQLLGQVDGRDVITVDDLAENGSLHPVQQAMVEQHGSQCGFCTPGIVMSLFAMYHAGVEADRATINDWLAGNLCRCTGYRPIADAARISIDGKPKDGLQKRRARTLRDLKSISGDGEDVFIGNRERFIAAPASIASLAKLCAKYPDATIVSGATDVGLWITKQLRDLPRIILTGRASGFADIEKTKAGLRIGAGATYADAFKALGDVDPDIQEVLRRLGSKQVRASGTIGGNIANGSPIGDSPPLLIALDAELELLKGRKTRRMKLEKFFIDYGKQDRKPGELVAAIHVPRLSRGQHFRAYKISKRFDQDISALLGAFRFTLKNGKITDARIAYGGMAATPKRAAKVEAALLGGMIGDDDATRKGVAALAKDFQPISDMRASADYRLKVAQNLLRKALLEISDKKANSMRVVGHRDTVEPAQ